MTPSIAGKRIGLLSSWAARPASGIFECVVAQADILHRLGAHPVVIGNASNKIDGYEWLYNKTETQFATITESLARTLFDAELDMLHLHGLWRYPSAAAGRWSAATRKPFLISPHGLFDPWMMKRRTWGNFIAERVWEGGVWQKAAAFHAATEDEAADITAVTGGGMIAVIPPAVPIPREYNPRLRGPHALYVGRIQKRKNLTTLLRAWEQAMPSLPSDSTLTIAVQGSSGKLDRLRSKSSLKKADRVQWIEIQFTSQRAALHDYAKFVVSPSSSESVPLEILHGFAYGIPSIMSRHCHLDAAFSTGVALDCGTSTETIRDALIKGLNMQEADWQKMSAAARAMAEGRYSIDGALAKWNIFYSALLRR